MDTSVVQLGITRNDSVVESDLLFAVSPAPAEATQLRESEREAPNYQSIDRQASSILAPPEDEDIREEMTNGRKRKRTEIPDTPITFAAQPHIIVEDIKAAGDFVESCGVTNDDAQRHSAEDTEHETLTFQSTDKSTLHLSQASHDENGTMSPFERKRSKSPEPRIVSSAQAEISTEKAKESVEPEIAKVLERTNILKGNDQELTAQTDDAFQATQTSLESPRPTLAEEAVSAMKLGLSKTRKFHLRQGDVLIVLDAKYLGLSCRIGSENLKTASAWFADSLQSASASDGPDGVKYLYTLRGSTQSEETPRLVLTDLAVPKHACAAEIYTRPMQAQDPRSEKRTTIESKKPVKEERDGAAGNIVRSETKKSPNWLKAYETFFRIISHIEPRHLHFNQKDINDAIPHISAVSMLASLYRTTSYGSAVTSAFTVLFFDFEERNMLLGSIAGKPLQWLIIATNLERAAIFKEAFVHVVSAYPSFCDEALEQQLPRLVRTQVSHRAKEMQYRRIQINDDLLTLSIFHAAGTTEDPVSPSTDYLAYGVLVYFQQWIAEHVRYHSKGGSGQLTSAFCDHSNGNCHLAADFYRLLAAGDYLPDTQVFEHLTRAPCDRGDNARELGSNKKETVRNILKTLKAKAVSIVKPIVASTLCWTGSASLSYLTSLEMEDNDYPWEPEIKQKDSVTDSEESEDEDTD